MGFLYDIGEELNHPEKIINGQNLVQKLCETGQMKKKL